MHPLIRKLVTGDLRQKGKSEAVVAEVLKKPALFGALVDGLRESDPALRMRVADAIEKISRTRADLPARYKRDFLSLSANTSQKEVRWHLAQVLPRLPLTARERERIFDRLVAWLEDESRIVKTFAMQALADLSHQDARHRTRALMIVHRLVASGIPAVQSRARKLLLRLRQLEPDSRRRSSKNARAAGSDQRVLTAAIGSRKRARRNPPTRPVSAARRDSPR